MTLSFFYIQHKENEGYGSKFLARLFANQNTFCCLLSTFEHDTFVLSLTDYRPYVRKIYFWLIINGTKSIITLN